MKDSPLRKVLEAADDPKKYELARLEYERHRKLFLARKNAADELKDPPAA